MKGKFRLLKLFLIYMLALIMGLIVAILVPNSDFYGLVFYGVIIIGLVWYVKIEGCTYKNWFQKPSSHGKKSIILGVIFVFLLSGITLALFLAMWTIGELKVPTYDIFTLLAACICAPIIEEIICRGIIIDILSEKHKSMFVVLVSALIFYVIHGNPANIGSFFFGIIAAMIVQKTKSILPGICLHFIWNLNAKVVLYHLAAYIGSRI